MASIFQFETRGCFKIWNYWSNICHEWVWNIKKISE